LTNRRQAGECRPTVLVSCRVRLCLAGGPLRSSPEGDSTVGECEASTSTRLGYWRISAIRVSRRAAWRGPRSGPRALEAALKAQGPWANQLPQEAGTCRGLVRVRRDHRAPHVGSTRWVTDGRDGRRPRDDPRREGPFVPWTVSGWPSPPPSAGAARCALWSASRVHEAVLH